MTAIFYPIFNKCRIAIGHKFLRTDSCDCIQMRVALKYFPELIYLMTRKPPQGAKAEYKKEDYNVVEYCKVEYYK